MLNAKDKKLRGIAAMLIVHGEGEFLMREKMLMAGLSRHKYDGEIMNAILELHGEDGLQQLIVQYASNPRIPNTIKTHAIQALQKQASADRRLPAETRTALIDTAWETSDYRLISAIKNALIAWRSDVPWIVYLKSKHVHSKALLWLFFTCALLNIVCCLAALFYVSSRPFEEPQSGIKRASSVIGWLALSVVMLGLQGYAFVGFLGHNSAPSPRHTVMFNIPLYLGTAIYLVVAWVTIICARGSKQRTQNGQ